MSIDVDAIVLQVEEGSRKESTKMYTGRLELTGPLDAPSTDRQLRSELLDRTVTPTVDRTVTRKRSLTSFRTRTGPRRRPDRDAERLSDCCVDRTTTPPARDVTRTGLRRLHVHLDRTVMRPDRLAD